MIAKNLAAIARAREFLARIDREQAAEEVKLAHSRDVLRRAGLLRR
jgi:hypothetical protein